jgi:hypothetical protein
LSVIERITQFVDYKGLSKRSFYQKTGLSNGTLDGNKDIRVSRLELISSTFPELNIHWVITSKGNMILTNDEGQEATLEDTIKLKDELIATQRALIASLQSNK